MIALPDLLASGRPPETAVCIDGAASIDFAVFRARVLAVGEALAARPEQRYALCIEDPFDFACALFALWAVAKAPVVPPNATPACLAELAFAYDAVLADADLRAFDAVPASHASHAMRAGRPIEPEASLTLFTSGSSGTPKAIHKTLAQLDAEVHTLEAQWGALAAGATHVSAVPHHHIYGLLFRLLWPLAAGRPFDRANGIEPQRLGERLARHGAALVVSTPAQLSRWPDLPGFASLAPAPRAFFSSGGPLDETTAARYAQTFGAAPLEIYGSTETGGIAWRRRDLTDAWQPMPGIDVRMDDEALEVRSPHLGHARWHRTDDAVAFDADGRFRLRGRLDRVRKLGGKRVSLAELEMRLAQHPYVAKAAVTLLEGASRERLGALVVPTEAGAGALLADGRVAVTKVLHRHLAERFDAVVLPRRWRFRAALPFDARGKLPAAAVAAAFAAREEGFELLAEARHGGKTHYALRVPATLAHFAGHFPGLAILPGVVQIDWAMRLAADETPEVRTCVSIDRLKFMAPVPPGALLDLTLAHDAARGRVQFSYRLRGRDCASGVFVYRGGA
ncbi:AMP-dependent synthetase [Burkholderia sp. WAC0059]|uniref:AMP-binding protein n=1 Tax=Burkholderia sp. WAC0059 TaxID=2066022 RepID=UPI000C7F1F6F|nr:AMP-binding protein [Burkholderia sp. WAC0059]PLZ04289.1 AMP-dependent synthetase [Burkholderia sp. WAC0059]